MDMRRTVALLVGAIATLLGGCASTMNGLGGEVVDVVTQAAEPADDGEVVVGGVAERGPASRTAARSGHHYY